MGVGVSSYPHSCSPRFVGNLPAQHTLLGSPFAQQHYGGEAQPYSQEHGPEKPPDKKKRSSGLATLKRCLVRRRRSGRATDHGRHMRELLSGWDVRDAGALVEEYEGTAALRELSVQAGLARPKARTLARDLASLYEWQCCSDVELLFRGARYPSHRAILAARCPSFAGLLSSEAGARVPLDVRTPGVDAAMFSALLRYLYTGELPAGDARMLGANVLLRLSEEFGTPGPLGADMRGLFERMQYYDSLLTFLRDGRGPGEDELRAHRAVLSARSPFFRNLLRRRVRVGAEEAERPSREPIRIVLDESVIPRKYASVILLCMYTDEVDLSYVLRAAPSAEERAGIAQAEEAMELYPIALFLEFSMLAQGCEDLVVESLSLDSLVSVLRWSSQPYGSKWVHRQALRFLCEEFGAVMASGVLYELSKEHLLAAIQSDYLQASEQDILKHVIKWGEHQLIKRMADREPNLLSGTTHSVNKRGVKRRDLDVEELKEMLSPLLLHIRVEHILPADSEVLSDAMKRGLFSTPPSDMLPTAEGGESNAWLRQKSAGIYNRPRLFTPYVEEAKSVLEEMMLEQADVVRVRMVRMSNVPDTLYMVNNAVPQCCHTISHQQIAGSQVVSPSVVANEIPVPELAVVTEMMRRLRELRHTELVQRAYALNCGEGATVSYELQIRVLREFGLPDGATELLQNPHKFFPDARFGDESPVPALRPGGRSRIPGGPPTEGMLAPLEAMGFHPPLPPPPPPYLPPCPRPCAPGQPPSRSLSYAYGHAPLLQHPAPKHGSPAYPPEPPAPDCATPQGPQRTSVYPDMRGNPESVISEFMPDIAVAVSAMSLKERRVPEVAADAERRDPRPSVTRRPVGQHHGGRRNARKRHVPEAKPDFPDLYEFSSSRYTGPDLYSHSLPPTCPADLRPSGWPATSPLSLDVLEQPPQRLDLTPRVCPRNEAAVVPGVLEGCGPGGEPSEDYRSPSKPDYPYRKSAL